MSAEIILECFDGINVGFQAGDAFVNATDLCAVFGKRPSHFMQLESTASYIIELEAETNGQPVSFKLEGRNGGTWMHPDLAMECARWLSPRLAIWGNRVIRKILSGELELKPALPQSYLEALKALTVEVEANERLALENVKLADSNAIMVPKAEFFDCAMTSKQTLLVRDAAKLLNPDIPGGMGEKRLFSWMRANGWLFGDNRIYQTKIDAGYMVATERPIPTGTHGTLIKLTPRFTQIGIVAIRKAILKGCE